MFKEVLTSDNSLAFSRKAQNAALAESSRGVAEALVVSQLEKEKLGLIVDVLGNPELNTLTEEGKITFGAIKPQTQESKLGVADDNRGEEKVLDLIKPPLQSIFEISLVPSASDIETFYGNIKNNLVQIKDGKGNAWDSFKAYMTSGPVTYFLLHDPEGNAVLEWRKQMGATNPKNADPKSIRGKYGISISRNLVHGSSGETTLQGIRNVKKETAWLRKKLENILSESDKYAKTYPSEKSLKDAEILRDTDMLVSLKKYTTDEDDVFAISYKERTGRVRIKFISQESLCLV